MTSSPKGRPKIADQVLVRNKSGSDFVGRAEIDGNDVVIRLPFGSSAAEGLKHLRREGDP